MAFVLADRVKETSTTIGTTKDLVLGGSFGAYQTFSIGVGDGNTTYYVIENNKHFEVGIGKYTASTNILSRDTVLRSSLNGARLNLSGVSIVFVSYPADKGFILDEQGVASGISPSYTGLAFPDGTVQQTATYLQGTGVAETIPYWTSDINFGQDVKLKWRASQSKLAVDGNGDFTGELNIGNKASVTGDFTLVRSSAGNILHGYVDNEEGTRIGLHLTNESSPTWKLGLKESHTSFSYAPDQGYMYGRNGSVGMYSSTDSALLMHYTTGFWIKHKSADLLNVDIDEGVVVDNSKSTTTAFTVKSSVSQTANLQEFQDSLGSVLSSISNNGAVVFDSQISDTDAPNKSLYYSSTKNKLVFKDSSGSVNELY